MLSAIALVLAISGTPPITPTAVAPTPAVRAVFDAEKFHYFVGQWSGAGTFERTGATVASTLAFESVVDGQALQLTERETPPNKFAYTALWTLDSASGGLVMVMASNNGGGARLFRSSGWVEDRIVFQSDPALHAWFAFERISFVRRDDRHFSATYEVSRDGKTWTLGDSQVYSKA